MSRKRDGVINESVEELEALESEYRGKPEAVRITALKLLKLEPDRSIDEVAAIVGFSTSALKRWIRAYREGGLNGVIHLRAGGKSVVGSDDGLAKLKRKLVVGELVSLDAVQGWIEAYRKSLGPQKLAEEIVEGHKANRRDDRRSKEGDELELEGVSPSISRGFLVMLAQLDCITDPRQWLQTISQSIVQWFADVDHVNISINLLCDIGRPEEYAPYIAVRQGDLKVAAGSLEQQNLQNDSALFGRFLDGKREDGFPLDKYLPPRGFVYYHARTAYVGVIALWRERNRSPISHETLEQMGLLEHAFAFLLSDLVARHRASKPIQHVAFDSARNLTTQLNLTKQESRVLHLQVLGYSYDGIADTLNISVNTVRSHVKSIYEKGGVHGQTEFMARYFTFLANGKEDGAESRKRTSNR